MDNSRTMAKIACQALNEKKAEELRVIDIKEISPVADCYGLYVKLVIPIIHLPRFSSHPSKFSLNHRKVVPEYYRRQKSRH